MLCRPTRARHLRRPASGRAVHGCAIELDRTACGAGESVSGALRGDGGDARVTLDRWETHSGTTHPFVVSEATPLRPEGGFALAVPVAALPSATGDRCSLAYAVVVSRGRHTAACAALLVRASARPHVDTGSHMADRLLRTWDARHFHIELVAAELRGGGSLAGRVHRHGPWPSGRFGVTARCIECWRCLVYGPYAAPHWDEHTLWQAHEALRVDPSAHWAPFRFALPAQLPPAVEGRTIAWRYEVLVSRNAHRWQTETAALTPLLFEESTARAP